MEHFLMGLIVLPLWDLHIDSAENCVFGQWVLIHYFIL